MSAFGRIKPAAAAAALTDPASFATTLACVCHDEWGTAWLTWHPETLAMEVRDTWRVVLSDAALARLMAANLVLSSDRFYKRLEDFRACCRAFSGGDPAADDDPLDALECGWGITEALLLDPLEGDPEPFCEEVRRYIGVVLAHEGIVDPPDVLRVAIVPPRANHPLPDNPELAHAAGEVARIRSGEIKDAIRDGLSRIEEQRAGLGLSGDPPTSTDEQER